MTATARKMERTMADKPITDAGVIEQIRAAMPTANYSQKGLMDPSDKILITKRSGIMNGEMTRVCKIDISWLCISFLLLICCDNQQSLEIIRVYVEGNYNSSNVNDYVHRTLINGNKLVEIYFKDGYLFLRRDGVSGNGYMTIIGGINSFLKLGVVEDVSSYTKLNT